MSVSTVPSDILYIDDVVSYTLTTRCQLKVLLVPNYVKLWRLLSDSSSADSPKKKLECGLHISYSKLIKHKKNNG